MCENIYTYTGRNIDTMNQQTIQNIELDPVGATLILSLYSVSKNLSSKVLDMLFESEPPAPNRAGTAFVPLFCNHDRLSPSLELLDNRKYLFFQNDQKYLCHDFLKRNFHSLYHRQISVNSKTYHLIEHLLCSRQAP